MGTEAKTAKNTLEKKASEKDQNASPHGEYKNIFQQVYLAILCTKFCERVAYYGLTGSLTIFFTKIFGLSTVLSTELTSLCSSLSCFTPILGAYIADIYLGRSKTILVFCVIYIAGMSVCAVAAYPIWMGLNQPIFFIGLYLGVTIGSGGIKPNLLVLGADQFDSSDPKQEKDRDRFFVYFFWALNLGSILSFSVVPTIALKGAPPLIPEGSGFFISFLIATIFMGVATIIFLIGWPHYIKVPPEGSVLARFFRVVVVLGWPSSTGKIVIISCCTLLLGMFVTTIGFFVKQCIAHLVIASIGMLFIFGSGMLLIIFSRRVDWIEESYNIEYTGLLDESIHNLFDNDTPGYGFGNSDDAHENSKEGVITTQRKISGNSNAISEKDVHNAKDMLRLLPYFNFMAIFWACYEQMSANFIVQGCQMNLRTFNTQVSPVSLKLTTYLIIIVFIPIFDRVIYPAVAYCRAGRGLSSIEKIGAGLAFGAMSMFVAGIIEIERKASGELRPPPIGNATKGVIPACCLNATLKSKCSPHCIYRSACAKADKILHMNNLSIWWQVLPYMFIGFGEVLAPIASSELFYSQVPVGMRSVSQSLNMFANAIGASVTAGLNSLLEFWIPKNLNEGRLEHLFFIIGVIALASFMACICTASSYELKVRNKTPDKFV